MTIIRYLVTLLVLVVSACARDVTPQTDANVVDVVELDQATRPDASPAPDVVELDQAEPEAGPAVDAAAWGCDPCERLFECCQAQWGPACEDVLGPNYDVPWCHEHYGERVRCAPGCGAVACDVVRARACE